MRRAWFWFWSGLVLLLRDWVDRKTEELGPYLDEHYGEQGG